MQGRRRAVHALLGVSAAGAALAAWGCGPALTALGVVGIGALDKDGRDAADSPPAVSVTTPSGTVNDIVAVSYRLTDADPFDRASVTVEYGVGGGAFQAATQTFADGAEGTQNLATSPAGTDHVFLWNSAADLGFQDRTDVRLRLTVVDAASGAGAGIAATTAPFTVFNTYMTTLARPPVPAGVAPAGLTVLQGGHIVVADSGGHRVVRIDRTSGTVALLAGTGEPGYNATNIPGTAAQLNQPLAVAPDGTGGVLVADTFNALLRRIDGATGFISDVAGGGDLTGDDFASGGVLAPDAAVAPRDVATDAAGNPFVLTLDGGRVRALNTVSATPISFPTVLLGPLDLDPGRIMTVYAALPGAGGSSAFTASSLVAPVAVTAWEQGGTKLVYALQLGERGNTTQPPALGVANYGGASVSFETPSLGQVTVGSGETAVLALGGDLPTINDFADLALVSGQVVLLATGGDGALHAFNFSAAPTSVAGTTVPAGQRAVVVGAAGAPNLSVDGLPPLEARLIGPFGVAVDPAAGHLLLSEANGRVRVVADPGQDFTLGALTVARGTVGTIPVVLPGTQAAVVTPLGLSLGRGDDLLVTDSELADPRSNRVLVVRSSDATVTGLAGNGVFGDTGDGGPAADARLGVSISAAQDPTRSVVVFSDFLHARVRAVNTGGAPVTYLGVTIAPGAVETVVGTGAASPDPMTVSDGPAAQATLRFPSLLAFDARGLLWLSDSGDNRIRVCNPGPAAVTVLGVSIPPDHIRTVVGTGAQGSPADDGDGDPAASAKLSAPAATLGADGNLWILDGLRELVDELGGAGTAIGDTQARARVVNLQAAAITLGGVTIAPGEVETVIGAGVARAPDDSNLGDGGPALQATFREPSGLSARADGLVFVSDSEDDRVRVVNVSTTSKTIGGRAIAPGEIETVLGAGLPGYSGDPSRVAAGFFGVATAGLLDGPTTLHAHADGRLLFVDSRNGAVRMANLADGPRSYAGITAAPGDVVVIAGSRSGRVRARTPIDVEVDPAGVTLFTDLGRFNSEPAVLQVDPTTRVVTRAVGTQERTAADGSNLGDGGPALLATLAEPIGLDADAEGSLYIADGGNRRIRFVNRAGGDRTPAPGLTVRPGDIATLVDGTGNDDPADDDGEALASPLLTLFFPTSVDRAADVLWIADEGSGRVLRADLTTGLVDGVFGQVVVVAASMGTTTSAANSDTSTLNHTGGANFAGVEPGDVVRFAAGQATVVSKTSDAQLVITRVPDQLNVALDVVRRGRPTAIIGIDADSAYLALSVDALEGARVWRLDWDGGARTFSLAAVAGTALGDWNGDLLTATTMNLGEVRGLTRDGDLLLVADAGTNRLVGVNVGASPATLAGITVQPGDARTLAGAGHGDAGLNGDAIPPAAALVNQPWGLAVSPDGGVVFVDRGNARLRRFQR